MTRQVETWRRSGPGVVMRASRVTSSLDRGLLATARADNWWSSKLPPLLAVAFAQILRHAIPAHVAWPALVSATVALCAVAWHAHVVNDLNDIEEDRLAGKANRMIGHSLATRLALLLGLPLVGIAAALSPGIGGWRPAAVLGLNFLVFALYSVKPFRLKSHGWWGACADALGAHALPTAFVLLSTPGGIGSSTADVLFAASAVTGSLAAGLRGIITHQFADRIADESVHLHTVGTSVSMATARRLVRRVLLPVEIGALVLVVGLVVPTAPLLAVAAVVFVTVELARIRRGWTLPLFEPPQTSREAYLPLVNNDAYELWLPIALALQLALESPGFLPVPFVLVALFSRGMRRRALDIVALLPQSRPRAFVPRPASAQPETHLHPGDARPDHGVAVPASRAHGRPSVVIGATYWVVNGVNVFSANLARGLTAAGESAHVLLTESATSLISINEALLPRAFDVDFVQLPVRGWEPWGAHWGEMIRYLESLAPCIYIPNSDWRHSCVSPLLSDRVGVVGIVHSDDPLHYDHVRRLGASWNAIVAVSSTLAQRTVAMLPALADRIVTIPIGVRIPASRPERRAPANSPLRIIYHGALKRHQKRIFDLPRIMEALAAQRVAARLTIAGSGPDEAELRERCRGLVERGMVVFAGVVPNDDIPALLAAHDAYLLTSEFEGMPNALIEAMGGGLVPVVTRVASGSTELVQDGACGFLVPVGEIATLADRLARLANDPDLRFRLADAAFDAVAGSYRVEDMVADYRALFERVLREAREGRFHRERGELSHPPATVAGVSLFPEPLRYHVPGVGRFPGERDYRLFRQRVRAAPSDARTSWLPRATDASMHDADTPEFPAGTTVVVGVPTLSRNGVTMHALDLVRGLHRRGIAARLLVTEERTDLVSVPSPRLPTPEDLPLDHLPVARDSGWGAHWGATIRYLEGHAPCVYLPTFDWRHACVIPQVSAQVVVVGSLTSGDPLSEEQASRLGDHLDALVTTDSAWAAAFSREHPEQAHRVSLMPDGLRIPDEFPVRPAGGDRVGQLLVCPASAPDGWADDVRHLLAALAADGCHPQVTLLGSAEHPERSLDRELELLGMAPGRVGAADWPPDDALLVGSTVAVSWLASERPPRELVEAMAWGCIPLLFDRGGASHGMLRDRENCVIFDRGDAAGMAVQLAALHRNGTLQAELSLSAHLSALYSVGSFDGVVDQYVALFARALAASRRDGVAGPRGPMLPPPVAVGDVTIFPVPLPFEVPGVGRFTDASEYEDFQRERERVASSGTA